MDNRDFTDLERFNTVTTPSIGNTSADINLIQENVTAERNKREQAINKLQVDARQANPDRFNKGGGQSIKYILDHRGETNTDNKEATKYIDEKWKATKQVAKEGNYIFKWLDSKERDNRIKKADTSLNANPINIKDTMAMDILNKQGLPLEYLKYIRSAKTDKGLETTIEWAKEDAKTKGLIAKTMSSKEIALTTIASSLLTPDMVIPVALPSAIYKVARIGEALDKASIAYKASQVARTTKFIAGTEFGAQAATSFFHHNIDKDYTTADAITDTLIYGTIGTAITRFVTPKALEDIANNTIYGNETKVHKWFKTEAEAKAYGLEKPKIKPIDTKIVTHEAETNIAKLESKRIVARITRKQKLIEPRSRLAKAEQELKIAKTEQDISKAKLDIQQAKDDIKLIESEHRKIMLGHLKNIKAIRESIPQALKVERYTWHTQEPSSQLEKIYQSIKKNKDIGHTQVVEKQIDIAKENFPEETKQIEDLVTGKNRSFLNSIAFKKLSKTQKALVISSGLIGTSAYASGGSSQDNTATNIITALLVIALGYSFRGSLNALFKSKTGIGGLTEGLKNSLVKASKDIVHEESMADAGALRRTSTSLAEKAYTQFLSTSAPFVKAGGKAKEFITKMLFNKDFGDGALTLKTEWTKERISNYNIAEKKWFRVWQEENSLGRNILAMNQNDMIRFRELVMNVKEGVIDSDSKAIQGLLDEAIHSGMEHMVEVNKTYGTHGFDKIKYEKNYVPRLWRNSNINTILSTMTDTQIEAFRQVLIKSIESKNAIKEADTFIKSWRSKIYNASESSKADIVGMLSNQGLLKDGEDIDTILDAITGVGDRTARAKYKVKMNMRTLKEGLDELGIEGLGFNDILDRNSASIMDKLANQMYGTAAMSKSGYTSSVKLSNAIKAVMEQDSELGKQAQQIADIVKGVPLETDNKLLQDLSGVAKDLTIATRLPTVIFSMPPEMLQTLFSNGFFNGLKNVGKAIKVKIGKGTEAEQQLAQIGGLGRSTDMLNLRYAHRGFSNEFLESGSGAFNEFRKGTMLMRDLVVYWSGLAGIGDVLQLANKFAHIEQIAKIANNLEHSIPSERFIEFGITKERIARLKQHMKFDKDGNLLAIDYGKMGIKAQDDLKAMLFNMNQAITPETTVGETALFAHTSSLGRVMSSLVSYPMQQFNIQGIQGVKRMDKYSAIQLMAGIGGTYLGLSARNSLFNKGMSEEDTLKYSLLNSPQLLAAGVIRANANPTPMKTIQNITSQISNLMQFTDSSYGSKYINE